MAILQTTLDRNLTIQGTDVEWVRTHQCLGIWFDHHLNFRSEVEYLQERTINRIRVMRAITGLKAGAHFNVLGLYYAHAVRSLLDYASPALISIQDSIVQRLEVAQNQALRLNGWCPNVDKDRQSPVGNTDRPCLHQD